MSISEILAVSYNLVFSFTGLLMPDELTVSLFLEFGIHLSLHETLFELTLARTKSFNRCL